MLIGIDQQRIAFFLGDGDAHNFACKVACLLGRHGIFLARKCHAVLCLALNAVVGGDVFCRLGHAVHAVLGLH